MVKNKGIQTTWQVWLGLLLWLLVAAAVDLCAYGSTRWTNATRTLTSRLEAARIDENSQSPSLPRARSDSNFFTDQEGQNGYTIFHRLSEEFR